MVKAYKALGKHDFATYDKNARQSRNTLIRAGVPEHHIRELETFINKTIRQTAAHNKAHQGPRICMQWYSTCPEFRPGLSPGTADHAPAAPATNGRAPGRESRCQEG